MSTSSNMIRAESLRARQGKNWKVLLITGTALCLLASYGVAAAAKTTPMPPHVLTESMARSWMMMYLLAAIFGSQIFTRELQTGAVARGVLIAGRAKVLQAKAVVVAVSGLIFGLVAAVLAYATTFGITKALNLPFEWTREATLIVTGIVACNVLAALMGIFVGFITRNANGALGLLCIMTLLVEPGLQRLFPTQAQYLFTIALSALYRDVNTPLLTVPVAAIVAAAWLALAGFFAVTLFRDRDVVGS